MANENVNIVLRAVDKTKGTFKAVTAGLNMVKRAAFSLQSGLLAVGGVLGMGYLIKQSMSTIDALGKTASKIGIATEALGGLHHAADLTGVSTETMNMALQRMVRRVAEAAQGTGEAVKALDELGISAVYLNNLSPDQQFKVLADAMESVGSQSDRVRLAMKLFDSEGVALVNTMKGGAAAIAEMEQEAERLGFRLNSKLVAGVESANDSIGRLTRYITNTFSRVVAELAPSIKAVTDNLMKWVELSIADAGGPADFAKHIGIAFLDAGESVVRGTSGMLNAMINMANNAARIMHGFLSTLPESMGGLRQQSAIMKDLALQQQILTNKTKAGSGASKDAIANTQLQVAALQELLDTGQYLKPIDEQMFTPFDPSETLAGIQALKDGIQETMGVTQAVSTVDPATLDLTATSYSDLMELQYGYQMLAEGAQADHQRKMIEQTSHWYRKQAAMQQEARKNNVQTLGESGREIVDTLSGTYKEAFRLNKAFAIKDALIETYKAVAKAWGSYPFPLNVAPAAVALAKGVANVQAIRATQFREKGGPMTKGSPYIVGERGPELIVPNQAATAVPNDKLAGQTNVTINVTANDTRGFNDLLTRNRGTLIGIINSAMNEKGKAALI